MNAVRTESFLVRSYEVDAMGELSPPALVGCLVELAILHADELGLGFGAMSARGLTWVLSRLRVELDEPVIQGATLRVETFPQGVERLFALRDFRLLVGDTVVGRAATQWMLFDVEKRRAVWPDETLAKLVALDVARAFEEPFIKLGPLDAAPTEEVSGRTMDSRFADIDRNLHVTSTSYVGWALEAIPLATWQSSRLDWLEIHYLAECIHPCRVVSRAAPAADKGERVFRHAIAREGESTDVARLVTRWVPREAIASVAPPALGAAL